ncbi:hypothetical protein AVEN_111944-1, partial [Araneus ventricosus]
TLTHALTPQRVVLAFVREVHTPSEESYFHFKAQYAERKTNNIGFPNFFPTYRTEEQKTTPYPCTWNPSG